mgnify:FL=1
MSNIYIFLKSVWLDLINSKKENVFFLPFLLLLVTISFPLGINNIVIGFILVLFFYFFKRLKFQINYFLLIPIILFLWMSLSYFWTIDKERTSRAIPKEIILFILPIIFLFISGFNQKLKENILKYYSYSIVILMFVFILRAIIRYSLLGDSRVFFYHGEYDDDFGLVPKLLNAIHVSVYTAIAFLYFFTKIEKTKIDYLLAALLCSCVLLLSSKNIIVILILLTLVFIFFYSKIANKMRLRNALIIVFGIGLVLTFSRIKERFLVEFQSNTDRGLSHDITTINTEGVHFVSIYEAWNNERFNHADYFPGTAFRVYQARLFFELLNEEPIFWQGFGLNASQSKLLEKERKYNLYPGYGTYNFHNQYLQNFAELGFIGFILLILMLVLALKNSIQSKDFMFLAFTILMISLFLTESFLWRQRGVVFFMAFYCFFTTSNKRTIQE